MTNTDCSRSARNRRKLEAAAAYFDQSLIRKFYDLIDKVTHLVKENENLYSIISSISSSSQEHASPICMTGNVTPILKQLMINVERKVGITDNQKGTLLYSK